MILRLKIVISVLVPNAAIKGIITGRARVFESKVATERRRNFGCEPHLAAWSRVGQPGQVQKSLEVGVVKDLTHGARVRMKLTD